MCCAILPRQVSPHWGLAHGFADPFRTTSRLVRSRCKIVPRAGLTRNSLAARRTYRSVELVDRGRNPKAKRARVSVLEASRRRNGRYGGSSAYSLIPAKVSSLLCRQGDAASRAWVAVRESNSTSRRSATAQIAIVAADIDVARRGAPSYSRVTRIMRARHARSLADEMLFGSLVVGIDAPGRRPSVMWRQRLSLDGGVAKTNPQRT